MDITVYLPDELGRWAKDQDINLSATLREALNAERDRRDWIAEGEFEPHSLRIDDGNGVYTARLHAKELATDLRGESTLFLAEDEGVYLYHAGAEKLYGFDADDTGPVEYVDDDGLAGLQDSLDGAFYVALMRALGKDAVIDMGKAR
jgi:post-segregation antitoxin (ccd killing protein)